MERKSHCARCGEPYPCSDSRRADIQPMLRAEHVVNVERLEREYAPADYRLPEGWTWRRVSDERARWAINNRLYPLAVIPGATAWGVLLPSDRIAR